MNGGIPSIFALGGARYGILGWKNWFRILPPPFRARQGWRAYDDVKDNDGRTTAPGSNRAIELALHTALNASNLLLLTGAGSSFCAKNTAGLAAPTMKDLWDAVEAAMTSAKLKEIIALIPR